MALLGGWMAEEVYDPVARRERYLRERELAGPRKKQPPAVGSVGRHQPKGPKEKGEKKGSSRAKASKAVNAAHKKDSDRIRSAANAHKAALTAKLKEVLQKLNTEQDIKNKALVIERDKKLVKIATDMDAKLAAIPPIPTNASPEEYAALRERRSRAISKIKGDANRKSAAVKADIGNRMAKVNEEANTTKTFVKAVTRAQQEQARSSLKTSIDGAKQRYETLKKGLGPKEDDAKETETR